MIAQRIKANPFAWSVLKAPPHDAFQFVRVLVVHLEVVHQVSLELPLLLEVVVVP
jgi:hypothetical protein